MRLPLINVRVNTNVINIWNLPKLMKIILKITISTSFDQGFLNIEPILIWASELVYFDFIQVINT